MSLKKTALKGVKWTTIGTLGRSVFQLIQIAILTRFLPQEAFGLVAMALFVIEFSNIFIDMGFTSAILHSQNVSKNEYSSIYWLNIFISVVLYVLLLIAAPLISEFYKQNELNSIIPILGINLIITAVGRQHRTIMQKQFQFKTITLIEMPSIIIGLFVAALLAVKGFGVFSLIYSTLTASVISNGAFLYKNLRLNPIVFHFNFNETRTFFRIGGYTMGSTILDFLSKEVDVLIIGKVLGAQSLGVYTLSKQVALKLFTFINPVVVTVLSPLLASIQNDKEKIKSIFLKTIHYLALINLPIFFLLIVCSKETLAILYGNQYSEYYFVLSFLAFSYSLISLSNPIGSLQIATGRTDLGFKWTIFRIIVTPGVIYLGALYNIVTVAGLYSLLSLLFIYPLWFIQLKPMIGIKIKEYLNQFIFILIYIMIIISIYFIFLNDVLSNYNLLLTVLIKLGSALSLIGIFYVIFYKKSILEIKSFLK